MSGLSPTEQKLILHWGEMGTKWGLNRTVAQIYALLYLAPGPMPADEIAATLSVARSNVSTSLKELLRWEVIRVTHLMGDRRDHFEALDDVWETFRIVMERRKGWEIDPTTRVLRECLAETNGEGPSDHVRDRVAHMLEFFDSLDTLYAEVRKLPRDQLISLIKNGGHLLAMLAPGAE